MGYTRQGNFFQSGTIGSNPQATFGLQNTLYNQFPTLNIGGPDAVNGLAPSTDAIYVENSFDPSDTVTLIKGKHILHFGVGRMPVAAVRGYARRFHLEWREGDESVCGEQA